MGWTGIWKGDGDVMMEVTRELENECYVLTLKGIITKCLKDYCPEMSVTELIDAADTICREVYEYSVGMCEPNQIPAIVFMEGHYGQFEAIMVHDELSEEEVM